MGEIVIDHLCRLCLKETFSLSNIFSHRSTSGDPVYKTLNFLYDLEICQNDGLPSHICSPCLWRMIEFEAYKKNVHCAKAEILKIFGRFRNESNGASGDERNEGIGIEARDPLEVSVKEEMEKSSFGNEEVNKLEVFIKQEVEEIEEASSYRGVQEQDSIECADKSEILCSQGLERDEETCHSLCVVDLNSVGSVRVIPEMLFEGEIPGKDFNKQWNATNSSIGKNLVKSGLSNENLSVSDGKPYVCDTCNKSYMHKIRLGEHVRVHCNDKPYSCKVCDAKFKHNRARRRHELLHLKEKVSHVNDPNIDMENVYTCETCGRHFSSKTRLYYHTNKHTNKYCCSICGKSFTRKSDVKRHSIIHSNDKPFVCRICEKSFNRKSTLQRHLLTHSTERPFPCTLCDRRFKTKRERNSHTLIHLKKKSVPSTNE